MPYVNVKLSGEPLSAEKKRVIIKGITDLLTSELGKDPDYTFVVIDEVHGDNWGWKGTSVTEVRKAEAAAKQPAVKRVAVAKAPGKRGATRKA